MHSFKHITLRTAKVFLCCALFVASTRSFSRIAYADPYGGGTYNDGSYSAQSTPTPSPTAKATSGATATPTSTPTVTPSPSSQSTAPSSNPTSSPAVTSTPTHIPITTSTSPTPTPTSQAQPAIDDSSNLLVNTLEVALGLIAIGLIFFWFRRHRKQ